MWAFILHLLWAYYGGDVRRLGDPDYWTRSQAYGRLKAAGVWAVPALHVGLKSAGPEGQHRIRLLLDRRASWKMILAWAAVHADRFPPEMVQRVSVMVATDDEFAAEVYRLVDLSGRFTASDSRRWCQSMPYTSGTLAGDISYMLRMTRHRPDPTTPKTMPVDPFLIPPQE